MHKTSSGADLNYKSILFITHESESTTVSFASFRSKRCFFSFDYASAPLWNNQAISLVVTHEPIGVLTEERRDRKRCIRHQSNEVHLNQNI